jgi:hypothetical protein
MRTLRDVRRTLVDAEVLAAKPQGSGFQLLLPFGTLLAERLIGLYLAELARTMPFDRFDPPVLIPWKQYEAALAARGIEYRNMYLIELDGMSYVVCPDNLVPAADELRRRSSKRPLVAVGSLYRAVTGRIHPLIWDRQIWRAAQIVHRLDDGPTDAAIRLHLEACGRFLDLIAVPPIWVERPARPNHSYRSYYAYTCPSLKEFVAIATLFDLARPLTRGLGLSGRLLDFGLSTRLLACATALHSDDAGYLCPTSLATPQVVVGAKTPNDAELARRLAAAVDGVADRVEVDERPWHRVLRVHRRRGTPVRLLADGAEASQLITRIDDRSVPLTSDPARDVREALDRHDVELRCRARQKVEDALRVEAAVAVAPTGRPRDGWHSMGTLLGIGELSDPEPVDVLAPRRTLYY